jgi:hypothetical protein
MGSEGIYRKTEKGRTEITTRANKLGMRERTMLIMVDDKTTRSGLVAKNSHPGSADILDALMAQGFIELAGGTEPAAAVAAPAAAAGGAPAATTAPPAPAAPPVEVSIPSASRYACRALVTYLGPSADDLTALVEKANGLAELATRLEKCRQTIQAIAGRKKADEFWAGVSARLPSA